MVTAALRTTTFTLEYGVRRMVVDPWGEFEVELFKEDNILGVVLAHQFPAFLIAPHAARPEFMARVADFFAEADELTDVIQFVADKSEFGLADRVEIEMFARRWWGKTMLQPLPVKDGYIELFTVVVYDYVRLFTKPMDSLKHVRLRTALNGLKEDSFLPQPFRSPAENTARLFDLIYCNVLLPEAPDVG